MGLEATRSSSPHTSLLFVEWLVRDPQAQLLLEDPGKSLSRPSVNELFTDSQGVPSRNKKKLLTSPSPQELPRTIL